MAFEWEIMNLKLDIVSLALVKCRERIKVCDDSDDDDESVSLLNARLLPWSF